MKQTIIDLLENSEKKFANSTFFVELLQHEKKTINFKELKNQVYRLGSGLVSWGIKPKDKVAILSEGSSKWIISELSLLYAGAISVPLSIKLEESSDLLFRLNHGDVSCIFVTGRHLEIIRSIRSQLPKLERIMVMDYLEEDSSPLDKTKGEIMYDDVVKMGDMYLVDHKEEFLKIGKSIQNDDIATITYTSGTTADPKGVVLTHRNYTANVEQALNVVDVKKGTKMLIILPLDHCFAHVVGFYAMLHNGGIVATVPYGKSAREGLRNIPLAIQEFKPNILLSVPALAKSFKKSIEASVKSKGKFTEKLFNHALKVSMVYNKNGYNKGTGWTCILKPFVKFYQKHVFSKVASAMGGELDFFVGGGALLGIDLQKFYYAIGMPMYQGYGLSEATPVISTNCERAHILGSSGILVSPMELKIVDSDRKELPIGQSGEIAIKGENVMAGYWKNPKSTAETVQDGWLYTGDMGYMTKEGFLYVLGRFKSLLIASDGEKYAPEGIEESFQANIPGVSNAIMYNNQSPYSICILDVDKSVIPKGKEGLEYLKKYLDKYTRGGEFASLFPERWLPSTFIIADEPFSEKNKMVNSTMKIVRNKVEKAYAKRIKYAYTPEGKNYLNKYNIKAMSID